MNELLLFYKMFKRVYKELAKLDVSCNVIDDSNELCFNYKNKNMHVIFTRPYPFNPINITDLFLKLLLNPIIAIATVELKNIFLCPDIIPL